jgi:RHS repeat-associated protein
MQYIAKFNTHELDQTGLSYLTFLPYGKKGLNQMLFYEHKKAVPRNARYYDSDTGRFITPDPTVPDMTKTQTYNRYMFVEGNPISFVDMDGYQASQSGFPEMTSDVTDFDMPVIPDPPSSSRDDIDSEYDQPVDTLPSQDTQPIDDTPTQESSPTSNTKSDEIDIFEGLDTPKVQPDVIAPVETNSAKIEETKTTLTSGEVVYKRTVDGKIIATIKLLKGRKLAADEIKDRLLNLSQHAGGKLVIVHSGYRSQEKQDGLRTKRAAKRSPHTYDQAADISIKGLTRKETAKMAHESGQFNRVNYYKGGGYTHVDLVSTGNQGYFINWDHQK